jgi:hypothetical protein
VHWLWKDLAFSPDAHIHWKVDELPGFDKAVKRVVVELQKCTSAKPEEATVRRLAKTLACAWSAANNNMDCPAWVPDYIRVAVQEQRG